MTELVNCSTCRFFDLSESGEGSVAGGLCRRYAPLAYLVRDRGLPAKAEWPMVLVDDWCGDWQPGPHRPVSPEG